MATLDGLVRDGDLDDPATILTVDSHRPADPAAEMALVVRNVELGTSAGPAGRPAGT